ncbi:hypothetical protein L209DRAFT_569930 [Thermothelomyces heterothallicus CBS 203.75]
MGRSRAMNDGLSGWTLFFPFWGPGLGRMLTLHLGGRDHYEDGIVKICFQLKARFIFFMKSHYTRNEMDAEQKDDAPFSLELSTFSHF